MGIILGIDIGGSATKAAGIDENNTLIGTLRVTADHPRTSAYGVLGRFLEEHHLKTGDISRIALTGLGSTFFDGDLASIPTVCVAEIDSIARGGLSIAGLARALVVSMGTGTAFIRADGENILHLGGSGVGGGTLCGLGKRFVGTGNVPQLSALASAGDRAKADLTIADLQAREIPGLTSRLTASNFGRETGGSSPADEAAALFNMIYETVGVMAAFALSRDSIRDVVLTGSLASLPQAKETFDVFNSLPQVFGPRYLIPENAAFATAIGAAQSLLSQNPQIP